MAASRWVVYQRERFPLAAHVPLVGAFSVSAVSFSALLRDGRPSAGAAAVAFLSSLLFFLQLRIADEWKDAAEDARWRPYRPVPRGLVTLAELRNLGIAAAGIQAGLALWLQPSLLWLLGLTWSYLVLMTREFYAGHWLRARPLAYMASHMLIVPLIDFYATACDWWAAGGRVVPGGLSWFLVVSFCNGLAIEMGRKMRAPEREEPGVETYTVLWGTTAAPVAWLTALGSAATFALVAADAIRLVTPIALALAALLSACAFRARRFARAPAAADGGRFEALSWIWTVAVYVMLGVLPLVLRQGRA